MRPLRSSGFDNILNPAIPQLVPSRNPRDALASLGDGRSQIDHAGSLLHCDINTACLLLPGSITSLDCAEFGPGYAVIT